MVWLHRKEYGTELACPNPECGNRDEIEVEMAVWVTMKARGRNADMDPHGDPEWRWDEDSSAHCPECNYTSDVRAFTVQEDHHERD